ncbi:MAG: hypothetical protein IJT49_10330 [Clostridia bacterium]|nr:hypothetical protein [Clostridia bacterium]
MKKILAIAIVAVMAIALCVSASANLNIDRIFVNADERIDGAEATDVKANDPIEINAGDKVYILGWAYGEASNLKAIVYSIDDGADVACSDVYRDRADVAGAFGLDESFGVHAGFGTDTKAEDGTGGMMELTGIGSVAAGDHKLTLKAIYNDDTSEVKDYNLKVSGEAKAEDPKGEDEPATTNPTTADASVIAIAAVACIALAGIVVAKKVR